jgi:DNA-binding beta-propeller fold protein YncE
MKGRKLNAARRAPNTAGPPIIVGPGQTPMAETLIVITPDGRTAYVPNYDLGTVTPISTRTNTAGPPIPVGMGPGAIAVTPGRRNRLPVYPPRVSSGLG